MKKIAASLIVLLFALPSFSQEEKEDKSHKFRTDHLFIGGSIGLGLGGGGFSVGANPEIGYSITEWLDAGISTNFNYFSFRAESNDGFRQRSINYGGGIFVRLFPIKNFFIQLLPEYNVINTSLTNFNPGANGAEYKINQQAPSFLAGVGYGSRIIGGGSFFTVLMMDLGNNTNSPYIDTYGAKLPILRTGFNFYLGSKRR